MGSPYVGEIRMFGGNFAPRDWALCNGQLIAISQNTTLFTLIGTTYGGDGVQTFQLPDLRGRLPIHFGTNPSGGGQYVLGQPGGVEEVTLTSQQIPQHNHAVAGSTNGGSTSPSGNTYGSGQALFSSSAPSIQMSPSTVANSGSSQPHSNFMPYLCVNFIISLFGIFPSQN